MGISGTSHHELLPTQMLSALGRALLKGWNLKPAQRKPEKAIFWVGSLAFMPAGWEFKFASRTREPNRHKYTQTPPQPKCPHPNHYEGGGATWTCRSRLRKEALNPKLKATGRCTLAVDRGALEVRSAPTPANREARGEGPYSLGPNAAGDTQQYSLPRNS